MKSVNSTALSASVVVLAMLSGATYAQPSKTDLGKREFEANCASCHASDGKGNGPFVQYLRSTPPDLTTLAKRNGGVFPVSRLFETIEGGNVPSHSARDMPVWGSSYRIQAGDYYGETPYDPAVYVRSRVLLLVEYINRLQER